MTSDVRVVWIRTTDLRVHDHAPLIEAHTLAMQDGSRVIHLVTLDSTWFGSTARSQNAGLKRIGAIRAKFLLESINDLVKTLLDLGHHLLIFIGTSSDAFKQIGKVWNIKTVHTYGPSLCHEEQVVEKIVGQIVGATKLIFSWGWTLNHIADLPSWMQGGKKVPGRYKPFLNAVSSKRKSKFARSAQPAPTRENLAGAPSKPTVCTFLQLPEISSVGLWTLNQLSPADINILQKECKRMDSSQSNQIENKDQIYDIVVGGETAGLAKMQAYIWQQDRLKNYVGSSDSMTPGEWNALNSTTSLSAYLSHGCLSPRLLYDEVKKYEKHRVKNRSTYWVFHELMFRDFFAFSCIKWGRRLFCLQGPLDSRGHPWRPDNGTSRYLFRRWCEGRTGYPFVDAGMRQLKHEGHMPHLLRQVCAAFLVRDLRLDWRWGAEWFEQCLVDYTPDANWGNWGYRILPVQQLLPLEAAHLTSLEVLTFPIVHDPHMKYIRRWVPELRHISDPINAREPWRLAKGYRRIRKIDVKPRRDSPLWIMSVNRNNWQEHQEISGIGWIVDFTCKSYQVLSEKLNYHPPLVPPVELDILYNKIPVTHCWGEKTQKVRQVRQVRQKQQIKKIQHKPVNPKQKGKKKKNRLQHHNFHQTKSRERKPASQGRKQKPVNSRK